MFRRRIALVLGEAIAWMDGVELAHQAVARGLGEDRGGADGCLTCVTADDRTCWTGQGLGQAVAVDQGEGGRNRQRDQCTGHADQGCAEDIEAFDFIDIHGDHRPRQRACADARGEILALRFTEDFRIGEAGNGATRVEDDRGNDDGAGQRSATGFIDAGDEVFL